ncbi:unnamed protein product [Acanthocheilonema viteae]|uniref:C3H1-type domain-containing protein n=1 Tax=Acanthocheilonema viteae TaxID=6277 RepID=A0A498S608_ACAVI|nr:unnamed protein product [Acanthocheilonema viteae]
MPVNIQVGESVTNTEISNGAVASMVEDDSVEQHQPVSEKGTMSGNMMELHDSCYSSCSEESHSSLSRKPSDSIVKEIAQLSVTDTESGTADTVTLLLQNIEFATRLGYSLEQLERVFGKLGMNVRQEQILDELIKLRPEMMDRNSKVTESGPPSTVATELRSIVIDGSNIAMTHGRKEVFSCRGIRECVQFFHNRGHTDIIVFVPQFRRETARSDCPITDQYILFELEKENILVWTPSRRINGRRIVCHDDRYILKTAEEKDAVIVSNDEYRDLIRENPQYRALVDERLLMYSFVDGRFMPPDDPLGRHGPKLAQFLTKGNRQSQSKICPYARRCTYGNKCKYYHPERPNGIHISVTDRLMKEKQRRQFLSNSISRPMVIPNERIDHPAIARTQSLKIPISKKTIEYDDNKSLIRNSLNYHQKEAKESLPSLSQSQLPISSTQQKTTTLLLQNPPLSLHQIRDQHCPTLSNHSSKVINSKSFLPLTPIITRNSSATNITSHCYLSYPYIGLPYPNGNESCPDLCDGLSSSQCFIPNSGTLSDAYGMQTLRSSHLSPFESTYPTTKDERHRLQNILCQLFPEQIVLTVMEAFPDESNPQELCPRIIAELQKYRGNT